MPPILAFQSSVDATVTLQALVASLFARLPLSDHELVLFDINRNVDIEELLKVDPMATFRPLLFKAGLSGSRVRPGLTMLRKEPFYLSWGRLRPVL